MIIFSDGNKQSKHGLDLLSFRRAETERDGGQVRFENSYNLCISFEVLVLFFLKDTFIF